MKRLLHQPRLEVCPAHSTSSSAGQGVPSAFRQVVYSFTKSPATHGRSGPAGFRKPYQKRSPIPFVPAKRTADFPEAVVSHAAPSQVSACWVPARQLSIFSVSSVDW